MFVIKSGEHKVLIDSEEDYEFFKHVQGNTYKKIIISQNSNKLYAYFNFKGKTINLAHIFCGRPLKGYVVDHINGNSLDNRRKNLRVVSHQMNSFNKLIKTKTGKRWVARTSNGKFIARVLVNLGTYGTPEEAYAVAYNFMKKQFPEILVPE